VGGVTTKQRILDPERNLLTRWADWLENRAPPNLAGRAGLATTGDQARTYDPNHEPDRPAM
jgi:hyaluronan synthase